MTALSKFSLAPIYKWSVNNAFLSRGGVMLQWSVTFLIIALVAGALGLFHVEIIASQFAWLLFVVFLVLFLVSLVAGRRAPPV